MKPSRYLWGITGVSAPLPFLESCAYHAILGIPILKFEMDRFLLGATSTMDGVRTYGNLKLTELQGKNFAGTAQPAAAVFEVAYTVGFRIIVHHAG